jgi:hypothetical protein
MLWEALIAATNGDREMLVAVFPLQARSPL